MESQANDQSLLQLFEQVIPEGQWRELEEGKRGAQIYTLPVVVEMMLLQRFNERGTQQEAVHQIAAGRLSRLLPESKRVRERHIGLGTGGYSRACGRVSTGVMEQVCDQVLAELGRRIEPNPELKRAVMLLDGTSMRVEHRRGLLDAFPAGHNQHGLGHWGIVKWVALHDVSTGIALRPAWGPMYGPAAVSEQELAEQAVQRAPAGSVIIGDGNFGIFAFAHAVVKSKREVLFRLNKPRARALGAQRLLPNGECRVCWRPSLFERRKYTALPADAQIEGRLIVVTRKGFRDSLYLFTTLSEEAEKIIAWYAKRWNLELDLRTLKGTMRLEHLHGRSKDAIEKEFLIAVVAYGLVRSLMAVAADHAGLHPRELSFTRAYGLLNAMMDKLCSEDAAQRQQAYDLILIYIAKSKLPRRSKPRAYPRAVWGSGKYYPRKRPVCMHNAQKLRK